VTFKVVVGYLRDVDRLPRDAARLGLPHRCAFVMDTYSPDSVDDTFNAPLYHAMIGMVWGVLRCDRADVFLPNRRSAASLAELETLVHKYTRTEDMPVPEMIMFRGPAPAAFMESQLWALAGGPPVYHDSYTVAVFTSADVSDRLVAGAHDLSTRCEPVQRPLSPKASSKRR